ncbi:MAG TPA: lipopolysaccharide kinase InaA family protein [Gemmatimonadaceae bacterium]
MMHGTRHMPPPGYERLASAGINAVGLSSLAAPLREALSEGSFYEYAAHHPEARVLNGRGAAYAVPLPGTDVRAVVRRSRHGGLLAPLTGERFMGGTRAPRELASSLRLTRLGVATPQLLAYATYPDMPHLRRADVVTREIPEAVDLAAALMAAEYRSAVRPLLGAVARLIASLTIAGARHPDLNIKNVLIAHNENGDREALVIDVDRVWFDEPGARRVTERNLRRLSRSALKWHRLHALPIVEADLLWLAATVEEILMSRRS